MARAQIRRATRPITLYSASMPLLKKNDRDRKSTRLNSSHSQISYAVFCLKKKKTNVCDQHTALRTSAIILHGIACIGFMHVQANDLGMVSPLNRACMTAVVFCVHYLSSWL